MVAVVEVWREVRDEFIQNSQPGSVRLGKNWMQDYDLGKNEGQLARNLEDVRGGDFRVEEGARCVWVKGEGFRKGK